MDASQDRFRNNRLHPTELRSRTSEGRSRLFVSLTSLNHRVKEHDVIEMAEWSLVFRNHHSDKPH